MAIIVAAAGGGNWSATGTWVGGVVPTAADDVQLTSTSGNVTIDAASVCRSLDCTLYTGTLTHNGFTLTIGDATAGASNIALKLVAGMTYTVANIFNSQFVFVSSSTTTQTVDSGGKTFGTMAINHANIKLQLLDNLNITGQWTVTALNTFDMNGKTLTMGTSNGTFTSGSKTYNGLVIINATGSGLTVINGTPTFSAGFTFQMLSSIQGAQCRVDNGMTVSGGNLTFAGFAANSRLLVSPNGIGTPQTITNAGATMVWSNVDFRDITLGTSYDASGITGKCGDAGGNSGITFTTGVTQYYQTAVNSNWSDTTKWFLGSNGTGGAGRMPLPQDNAIFDANSVTAASKTITLDVPRFSKDLDFTGLANSPTFTISSFNGSCYIYGSLTLVSGMTWTSANQFILAARSSSITVTHAGKTVNWILQAPSSTLTMQDACIQTQGGNSPLLIGTLNTNNFNWTGLQWFSGNTATAILNAGSSTISVSGTGTVLNTGGSSVMNMGTSTFYVTDTSATNKTLTTSGKTYYNLQWAAGGSGIIILGAGTYNAWIQNGTGTKTIRPAAGVTSTFTGGASAMASGTAGNLITYLTSSAGSAATYSSSTTLVCDYISLKDSTASGATPFYAGANSTNVSGNTNWNFTAPPAPAGGGTLSMMGV